LQKHKRQGKGGKKKKCGEKILKAGMFLEVKKFRRGKRNAENGGPGM